MHSFKMFDSSLEQTLSKGDMQTKAERVGDALQGDVMVRRYFSRMGRQTIQLDKGSLHVLKNDKVKRTMPMKNAKITVGPEENAIVIATKKKVLTYYALEKSAFHDWMDALRLASKCSFFDTYVVGDKLGSGAYGEVFECYQVGSDKKYAVKMVRKENPRLAANVRNEIEVVKTVRHPNLVHTYETHETHFTVYFIMELMQGELFEELVRVKQFKEEPTRIIMEQVIKAINYLHNRGIMHRDVKLENVLFSEEPDFEKNNFSVKLSDFGLCSFIDANTAAQEGTTDEPQGTGYYMAPEAIRSKQYTMAGDMWSVGVCMYMLLSGGYPFQSEDNVAYFKNLLRCSYDFNAPVWTHVSDLAKDFISKLIMIDPQERMTAAECLEHEWLKECPNDRATPGRSSMLLNARRAGSSMLRSMSQRLRNDVVRSEKSFSLVRSEKSFSLVRSEKSFSQSKLSHHSNADGHRDDGAVEIVKDDSQSGKTIEESK